MTRLPFFSPTIARESPMFATVNVVPVKNAVIAVVPLIESSKYWSCMRRLTVSNASRYALSKSFGYLAIWRLSSASIESRTKYEHE